MQNTNSVIVPFQYTGCSTSNNTIFECGNNNITIKEDGIYIINIVFSGLFNELNKSGTVVFGINGNFQGVGETFESSVNKSFSKNTSWQYYFQTGTIINYGYKANGEGILGAQMVITKLR